MKPDSGLFTLISTKLLVVWGGEKAKKSLRNRAGWRKTVLAAFPMPFAALRDWGIFGFPCLGSCCRNRRGSGVLRRQTDHGLERACAELCLFPNPHSCVRVARRVVFLSGACTSAWCEAQDPPAVWAQVVHNSFHRSTLSLATHLRAAQGVDLSAKRFARPALVPIKISELFVVGVIRSAVCFPQHIDISEPQGMLIRPLTAMPISLAVHPVRLWRRNFCWLPKNCSHI